MTIKEFLISVKDFLFIDRALKPFESLSDGHNPKAKKLYFYEFTLDEWIENAERRLRELGGWQFGFLEEQKDHACRIDELEDDLSGFHDRYENDKRKAKKEGEKLMAKAINVVKNKGQTPKKEAAKPARKAPVKGKK